MQRTLLLLATLLISTIIWAQDRRQSSYDVIEQIIESYADDYSDDVDLTSVIEDLERIVESPININSTNRAELEQLHFLSSFKIEKLLNYQKKVGQIFSIYELYGVEGFSQEDIDNLAAFITFDAPEVEQKTYLKQELHLRYTQNIEEAEGFKGEEPDYSGIKPALLMKYRAQKGEKFYVGFTAENDSGEDFFSGSNKSGFDYYSGYAGYHGNKILKKVYIGDYQAKIGQGLIQWSNYGIRKSTEANNIRQTGQGIKGYSSTDENSFLRGAAAAFEYENLELITYLSSHNVDANIADLDTIDNEVMDVSSIQTSGYHRTESEMYDEDALKVQHAGASLKYRFSNIAVGINGLYQNFDAPLVISDQLYNKFNFSGKDNYNLSTDFLLVQNRFNIFGEAAISKSGGKAIVTGLQASPANEISFSVLYRNYAKDFHSINGTSFAEGSKNSNEKGIYAGVTIYPVSHIKVSGYVDSYETYWMKFTTASPIKGTDYVMQTDYTPTRKLEFYLRLKAENNYEKESSVFPLKEDKLQQVNRARFQLTWKPSDIFNLRFRTEWAGYKKGEQAENGLLIFTDLVANPTPKISGTARVAWFNADGYDSRIYAYENDVPLYFYIPGFSGNGMRYYLNLKYEILPSLTLYLKASQIRYFGDIAAIGTGNSMYEGNHLTGIKAHLKFRF